MPFEMKLRLSGGDALIRAMNDIRPAQQRRMFRGAITAAARPIAQDAKRRVPKQKRSRRGRRTSFGVLRKSITFVIRTYPKNLNIVAVIGPENKKDAATGRNPARYAHLVERGFRVVTGGTVARASGPQVGKAARSNRTGKSGQGTVIDYVEGRPFLRPAFESGRGRAELTLRRKLWEAINRAAKKAKK